MARKAYGYFPGCVAQESCRELYQATAIVADKLDFDLIELKAASCCGASVVNDMNRHLARMLNARTFAEAEALGLDTVLPSAPRAPATCGKPTTNCSATNVT